MNKHSVDLYNTCCVCLYERRGLTKLCEKDNNDVKLSTKLRNCVGELDWLEDYVIGEECLQQLDIVHRFQQLCFQTYQTRQAATLEENNKTVHTQKGSTYSNFERCCDKVENFEFKDYSGAEIELTENSADVLQCGAKIVEDCDIIFIDNEEFYPKTTSLEFLSENEQGNKVEDIKTADSIEEIIIDYNNDNGDDCDSDKSEGIDEECENTSKGKKERKKSNFSCDLCYLNFDTSTKLVKHSVNEHKIDKKDVKPFRCPDCQSRFISSSNLNQHMKYHIGNRKHMCTYCGRGFVTFCDLRVHEKQHLNKREYKCPSCPKNFNTHKDLRSHRLVVHTDPSLWAHCCSVCNKRFPIKSNFDAHMRRHNNDKPFGCHLCEKKFSDKCVLQKHMKSHTNIKPYKCTECDNEYKDRRVMEMHMAKKHNLGNVKVPERVRKHFCHICPKSYFAKNKLTRHLYTHSGEKPFVCGSCNKKFTDSSYLKQHMRNAHNMKEENANTC